MIILLIVYQNIKNIKKEEITWYEDFVNANKSAIGNYGESFLLASCYIPDFVQENNVFYIKVVDEIKSVLYIFKVEDNNIGVFNYLAEKKVFLSTDISKKDDKIHIKYSEIKNKTFLINTTLTYSTKEKTKKYSTIFFKLTETPLYDNSKIKERIDKSEIPPEQLPEELKNIDYKAKIDEIDKLLEERWNKTCNPANSE